MNPNTEPDDPGYSSDASPASPDASPASPTNAASFAPNAPAASPDAHAPAATEPGSWWRRQAPWMIGIAVGVLVALVLPSSWLFVPEEPAVSEDGGAENIATEMPAATIYACPMHPFIQRNTPGKCPQCAMTLEPLELTDAISVRDAQMIGLTTATVVRFPLVQRVRTVGRIEFNDQLVSHITAWVAGRVDRLYADTVGMTVRKGDHLVDLFSPALFAAQQEYLSTLERWLDAGDPNAPLAKSLKQLLDGARQRLVFLGLTPAQVEDIRADFMAAARDGRPAKYPRATITVTAPHGGVIVARPIIPGQYVKEGGMLLQIADLSTLWLFLDVYERDLPLIKQGQRVRVAAESQPGQPAWGEVDFIEPFVDPRTRTTRVRVTLANPILAPKESPMPGSPDARRFTRGMFAEAEIEVELGTDGHALAPPIEGAYTCRMHPDVRADVPGNCPICGMTLTPVPKSARTATPVPSLLALPAAAILDSGTRTVVYQLVADTDEGRQFDLKEVRVGPRAYSGREGDLTVYRPVLSGLTVGDVVAENGNFLLDSQAQLASKPSLFYPKGPKGGSAPVSAHAGH